MAAGKPVIATAYSGNLEFMTEENSYLVPFDLVPIGLGCEPYPPEARWAEPDVDVAARLMREVFDHPETARARAERARHELLETHGLEARARFVRQRLGEIRAGRPLVAGATQQTLARRG